MRNLAQKAAAFYIGARHRAKRRKSAWNAVLITVCFGAWLCTWYAFFRLVWLFHSSLYPEHRLQDFMHGGGSSSFRSVVCGFLMLFAPLPGSVAVGFMFGNVLFWLLPPARRIFEREARGYPSTGFRNAMRGLFKFAVWAVPPGMTLALAAADFLNSLR